MFVAKHYTRIGNKRYIPGEVIDQDIPAETREWLLSKEAIYEVPSERENFSPAPGPDPEGTAGADAPEQAEGQPAADDAADDAAEIDMDAEPPEIDALAGVVQPAQEPEETADSKTSAPKKSGRKGKTK